MVKILAKSFKKDQEEITLSKHTEDALKVFEKIKDKINDKHLLEATELAIFLHDLGKVLPAFQIKTLKNKDYEPFDISYEVPHSLFSVFWISKDKLKTKFGEDFFNFIISAISYHHWRDSFDDFISRDNEILRKLCEKIQEDWGEKLKNNLITEFSKFNGYKEYIDINRQWVKGILNRRSLMNYAIPPYKFDYEPLRKEVKKEWVLIAGYLQRCDHFASWCEEEGEDLNKVEIEPKNYQDIVNNIKNKIGDKAWQFNNIIDGNIILIAPTGYGKTEYAFLWSKGDKFIYTLPLRSAVNQIYDRAENIFDKGKTGLLHSDADVYLLEKEKDMIDPIKAYETARQISYPVLISTGDQFFPYGLRPPGYEKIFSLFSYSRLVIDEVQAYDPQACAIITKFIEWITKMGGKFLLMTATLPSFIRKRIEEVTNGNLEIINIYEKEKENFKKIFKHKIQIKYIESDDSNEKGENIDRISEKELKEIIKEAEKGKRILVILNTVNLAQRVFDDLKELTRENKELNKNIYLLHSRFTFEDRKSKESELLKKFENPKDPSERDGKIFVSTQIVEASLDLDADVLFTEICPLDALVQRMGRVLRRYFYRNGKVINKSDNKEYVIDSKEFKAYNEPNVYIWVFKDGGSKGGNRVYMKELINLSIGWLLKKKDINDLEDVVSKDYLEILKDLVGTEKTKGSKKKEDNVYQKLIDNKWKKDIDGIEIEISEYDKYLLINLFYETMESNKINVKNNSYLNRFYNTIDLLDSGWMSEKKSEAERLFREMYTVQVIPKSLIEEFIKDLKQFVNNEGRFEGEKFNYTTFKGEIISKFCVNVDLRMYMRDGILDTNRLRRITEYLYEIGIKKESFEKFDKLVRWLSDIYYDNEAEYENEKGFVKGSNIL
jgi:CRISPR-associated endonuclease/helicase Cas3